MLIQHGADVNSYDDKDYSALNFAAEAGNLYLKKKDLKIIYLQ